LSKFCTACGEPLQGHVKSCAGCGTPVTSKDADQEQEQRISMNFNPASAPTATRFLPFGRAAVKAGEMTLPQEMLPLNMPEFTNVLEFFGSGIRQILPGFKAAFRVRRRLIAALVLAFLWIVFIFLPPAVTDAVPAKLLSWLTFAQGGLQGGLLTKIGGIVGKGLLAVFFTSLLVDKSTWGQMKAGISAVTGGIKGDKTTTYRWLAGMALALILYNLMVGSTSLQNSMASIACLGLSLRSLAGAGRSEAANTSGMYRFMAGWGTGFAMALVLSVLPGAFNGYILGGFLLVAAVIAKLISRQREEVPAP
jgi:hypothetical protein